MAGKAPELLNDNWDAMLEESKNIPVLVDFTAGWCGPCKLMKPLVDGISEQYEGRVKVYVFDVDQNKDRAKELGVTGLPFVCAFKNGEMLVDDQIRGMPKDAKSRLINICDKSIAA